MNAESNSRQMIVSFLSKTVNRPDDTDFLLSHLIPPTWDVLTFGCYSLKMVDADRKFAELVHFCYCSQMKQTFLGWREEAMRYLTICMAK